MFPHVEKLTQSIHIGFSPDFIFQKKIQSQVCATFMATSPFENFSKAVAMASGIGMIIGGAAATSESKAVVSEAAGLKMNLQLLKPILAESMLHGNPGTKAAALEMSKNMDELIRMPGSRSDQATKVVERANSMTTKLVRDTMRLCYEEKPESPLDVGPCSLLTKHYAEAIQRNLEMRLKKS